MVDKDAIYMHIHLPIHFYASGQCFSITLARTYFAFLEHLCPTTQEHLLPNCNRTSQQRRTKSLYVLEPNILNLRRQGEILNFPAQVIKRMLLSSVSIIVVFMKMFYTKKYCKVLVDLERYGQKILVSFAFMTGWFHVVTYRVEIKGAPHFKVE